MARILVADDEHDLREVISLILGRHGHEVVTVADGAAAFETYTREDFDLIVTDLRMPGLDGVEVATKVRANGRDPVPILLVTASATDQDLARASAAGIDGHLTKPFRVAELRERVADLLGTASSRESGT